MKRLVKTLAVFLGIGMAGLTYAATEGTSSQTIEASISPQLEISVAPAGLLVWGSKLTIAGPNSVVGSITVKSNAKYDIRIKCSDSTKLYMKEYCPGSPTCTKQCTGSYNAGYATAGTPRTLQYSMTGIGDGSDLTIGADYVEVYSTEDVTPNDGSQKDVTFKQSIDYGDHELTSSPCTTGATSHTYRMGIYWFVTQSL
ncbi:MAG: hypothetical protein AB1630_12165 [bacterium]